VGVGKLRITVGRMRIVFGVFEVEVVQVDCAVAVGGRGYRYHAGPE